MKIFHKFLFSLAHAVHPTNLPWFFHTVLCDHSIGCESNYPSRFLCGLPHSLQANTEIVHGGADKSLDLYRKQAATGLEKCIYSTYSPWAPHTYNFVVLTSLTHTRKILLVVLQIGK
jgi:hypothetical protein